MLAHSLATNGQGTSHAQLVGRLLIFIDDRCGSRSAGPSVSNARQMNPRKLPDLCSAANGECVP
jgi:hypothetical protein